MKTTWKNIANSKNATTADHLIWFALNFNEEASFEEREEILFNRIKKHWTPITNPVKLVNGSAKYRFVECGAGYSACRYALANTWGMDPNSEEANKILSLIGAAMTRLINEG